MDWLDQKYIMLVSSRLDRFKKVRDSFNFRCPYCRDSKKSKTKARGWIISKGTKTGYFCHNCGASRSFNNFLKDLDPLVHQDYLKERLFDKYIGTDEKPPEVLQEKKVFKKSLKGIKKISQLDHTHYAREYVDSRLIPTNKHHSIYFAPKFFEWVNTLIPNKFKMSRDESRLVIPFYSKTGELVGFQGRSFQKNANLKYITIMLDENYPKVYGLDTNDGNKLTFTFEGPIDSMFIDNSIASCGGSMDFIGELGLDPANLALVYDNEPRSKETIKKLEKALKNGFSVVIFPSEIEQKDINDLILAGWTSKQIVDMLMSNIYSGLMGRVKLIEWKKI